MPRPRTISDSDVLAGVERVLLAKGPHDFTLADVARETGLAPATLLQRFGTKRALVEAFARRAAASARVASETEAPGLAALKAMLFAAARKNDDRTKMANSLALLLEDVRDPSLGASAREHARATEDAIARHLEAAAKARELRATDPRRLARTVYTAYNGALILWALRGRGTLRRALDEAIEDVLTPYRR